MSDDKPTTIHMAIDIPRYEEPPPAPCPFDLMDLLWRMGQGWYFDPGPGTKGGRTLRDMSKSPKVGDFVMIVGAFAPPSMTLGRLEKIDNGTSEYSDVWTVLTLSGKLIAWQNVNCRSLPVGDQFSFESERVRFQPWAKENGR